MAKETAAQIKARLQLAAKEEANRDRVAAKEKKYQDRYRAFLDDVATGEKRNFQQWKDHQRYKDKKVKDEAAAEADKKKQIALQKKEVSLTKETRNLLRDIEKTNKSNTGKLLEGLGITSRENNVIKKGLKLAKEKVAETGSEADLVDQKGWNLAAEARKQALLDIEMGVEFDAVTYTQDLTAALEEVGVEGEELRKILEEAGLWGKHTAEMIKKAGGGEAFAKKLTLSKEAMSRMDVFEEKIFKIKGFLTDPQFRGMMLKGMFIGLAVKAAKALGDAIKTSFDFAREMGISFKSMPVGLSLAKDEAGALLEEFGTLKDVTSENLIAMKWNAYWYGVAGTDAAKLAKLQMSITDSTLEMALDDQRDFMKELVKEGLSASKVFADMAGHSEFIAKYMKDGGENMEAAAKYAASMGLDLGIAESMADKLLDYESSIAAEMEASVLLGRSINLDKARQLAYSGKIKEMQEEVKRQVGGEAEFAKMGVVQREALGNAIGLNAVQLAEFVKAQEGSTEEQNKGAEALAKSALMGIALGAILGAIAVGFGAALWGALAWFTGGAASAKAISGGLKGLGKGMLAGAGLGAIGGGIGGFGIAAIKGMASGGSVKSGSPYIVGERGSELFVPTTGGSIIPHAAGGAGPAIDNSEITSRMDKQYDQNERLMKKLGSQFEFGTRQY